MDSASVKSTDRGSEQPPTLIAQSGGRAKSIGTDIASIAMATVADDKSGMLGI